MNCKERKWMKWIRFLRRPTLSMSNWEQKNLIKELTCVSNFSQRSVWNTIRRTIQSSWVKLQILIKLWNSLIRLSEIQTFCWKKVKNKDKFNWYMKRIKQNPSWERSLIRIWKCHWLDITKKCLIPCTFSCTTHIICSCTILGAILIDPML